MSENPNEAPPVAQDKQVQAPAQNLSILKKNITDSVMERVKALQELGEIAIPANYNPGNALAAAWFILLETKDKDKRPVLEVCTKESVANSLFKMVTKGLSVVKKQCYFIAYGNQLTLDDSYIGDIYMAKRDANVKDVNAVVVFQGDEFEYEINAKNGRYNVIKHGQKLENIDITKIKGAYAIVEFNDGTTKTEIMTIDQIKKAWGQGGSKGNSGAHTNFTDQMCKKTVIGRALKLELGSSDDSSLESRDVTKAHVDNQIRQNANKQELSMEEDIQQAEVVPEDQGQPEASSPATNGPDF